MTKVHTVVESTWDAIIGVRVFSENNREGAVKYLLEVAKENGATSDELEQAEVDSEYENENSYKAEIILCNLD